MTLIFARERGLITSKGILIRLTAEFLTVIGWARMEGNDKFPVPKAKAANPERYPSQIKENKTFPKKLKLRESSHQNWPYKRHLYLL